jgi:hypothetical protein
LSRFLRPLGAGGDLSEESIFDILQGGGSFSPVTGRKQGQVRRTRENRELARSVSAFAQAAPDFGTEFSNRVRAAQAARGFTGGGGGSGAAQEAAFVGRIGENIRGQLAPQLVNVEQAGVQAGAGAFDRTFNPLMGIVQGAPQRTTSGQVFSSMVQGALGGAQVGAELFRNFDRQVSPQFTTSQQGIQKFAGNAFTGSVPDVFATAGGQTADFIRGQFGESVPPNPFGV